MMSAHAIQPVAVEVASLEWLKSISPELAVDVERMESVENWRVDTAPGPWKDLFDALAQENLNGAFNSDELAAIINYLAYLGTSRALELSQKLSRTRPDFGLELVSRATDADIHDDPRARVTVSRVRRIVARRVLRRIFGPERRNEIIQILESMD